MYTRIINVEQLDAVHTGAILKQYPSGFNWKREDVFDESKADNIDTYRVRAVDVKKGALLLKKVANLPQTVLLPGNSNRVFIKKDDLIAEGRWWIWLP